jgi:hypothetical protein
MGQVLAGSARETRDTVAATTVLPGAVEYTAVRAETGTTERAPTYPPALHTVLPAADHRTGKLPQGIERDQQHLTECIRRMHCFQQRMRSGNLAGPGGGPRLRQLSGIVHARDELTACLGAALSAGPPPLFPAQNGSRCFSPAKAVVPIISANSSSEMQPALKGYISNIWSVDCTPSCATARRSP